MKYTELLSVSGYVRGVVLINYIIEIDVRRTVSSSKTLRPTLIQKFYLVLP